MPEGGYIAWVYEPTATTAGRDGAVLEKWDASIPDAARWHKRVITKKLVSATDMQLDLDTLKGMYPCPPFDPAVVLKVSA